VLETLLLGFCFFHIPNLGPFCSMTFTPATEATVWKQTGVVEMSNRVYPLELVPNGPLLLNSSGALAEAQSLTLYPSTYFSGPVRLLVNKEVQQLTVKVEASIGAGAWVPIDERTIEGAKTVEAYAVTVPSTAWRITLVNTLAQNYGLRATPSMTGST
jgi:hypothetical protein